MRIAHVARACLLTAAALLAAAVSADTGPDALVRDTVAEVLALLRGDADIQSGDRRRLDALVEEKVLPHFDFVAMTRLAAGRNWVALDEAQRRALTDEFRTLLVRTYSVALTRYRDETVEYPTPPPRPGPASAVVRSRIVQRVGNPIAMDYRLHFDGAEWHVYDILIDGISLVVNYRSLFSSTIEQSGAEGLLDLLRRKNAAGADS